MQKRKGLRLLAVIVALAMVIGFMPAAVRANEGTITVFVSFEGYNLGHGFYVEPTAVTVPVGASAWDASVAALEEAGIEFELNAWGFLDRIFGIHPGYVNLPEYITIDLEDSSDDGSIGAMDYTPYSGWMITVNHFQTPVGADGFIVLSGDVIRWHFSVQGWGADLGLSGHFAPLYEHADKTELIRGLFAEDANAEAIDAVLEVIINPLASDEDVNDAFAALELPLAEVDLTELLAAIEDAQARERETYVPADAQWDPPQWGMLQMALDAASVVADNPYATELAVAGATERLTRALAGLVPVEVEDDDDDCEDCEDETYNGGENEVTARPIDNVTVHVINGVEVVRFRDVALEYGYIGTLVWDGANRMVSIEGVLSFIIGEHGSFIHNNRTYMPVENAASLFE